MAVTNGYATVQELRDQIGDPATGLPLDLVERAINTTSRAIDRFCGRRFWADSVAQAKVYKAEQADRYTLWVDDISTTTGLIIATDTTGDGTYDTTWAATDYQLEPLNADTESTAHAWWRIVAVDRFTFPWHERRTTAEVTARYGWSAVPEAINQACILRAAQIFKRRESVTGIQGSDAFGAVRISRLRDPDVAALLDDFVKIKALAA